MSLAVGDLDAADEYLRQLRDDCERSGDTRLLADAQANLALVAFSKFQGTLDGAVFVFFILTIAAAEVAVGLAIIVALFRKRHTVSVDELNHLKN